MKKLLFFVLMFSTPVFASDCSTIQIMKNGGGKITPSQVASLIHYGDMHCVDMSKLEVVATEYMKARQRIDDATIFTNGSDLVIIKGTSFQEDEMMPLGKYKYLGVATVTKSNGFEISLPIFEKQ